MGALRLLRSGGFLAIGLVLVGCQARLGTPLHASGTASDHAVPPPPPPPSWPESALPRAASDAGTRGGPSAPPPPPPPSGNAYRAGDGPPPPPSAPCVVPPRPAAPGIAVPLPPPSPYVFPAGCSAADCPTVCPAPLGCPDPLRVPDPFRDYRNAFVGFSPSILPNGGLAVEAGGIFRRDRATWAWEVQATWQFIDDKAFVDDGNPESGDWYQIQGGIKVSSDPETRRHWTGRAGLVWFYADGTPNIVEEEGHYFGFYAAGGFEVDLTPSLTMGPSLTGMFVFGPGAPQVVPQFNWHVIWNF